MSGPGPTDGTSELFAKCASLSAIEYQLQRARKSRDAWDRHVRRLTDLRAERERAADLPEETR